MRKFRRKLHKKASRRLFRNTADRTHRRNVVSAPLRGGIRL